jgi:hypothetical protein
MYVTAAVVADVRLLVLYAARFPVLAGVPLGAVSVALVVMWIYGFRTYRRIQTVRAAPGLSADGDAALVQRYETQMRRLMRPTLILMLLFAAGNMLRT